MRTALLIAALLLSAGAASAAPIDRSKVYVSKPEACKALQKQGAAAFDKGDFFALTFADGIQSQEFHCNFYSVKSLPNGDSLLVEAICDNPGEQYPDLLAISPDTDTTIKVVSMEQRGQDRQAATDNNLGQSIFTRCDKLSELPRD